MSIETLKKLYSRDLNVLRKEIELYNNESNIWEIENHISNSAGNLCLHLIGNLKNFIGKEIGNTGYVRNRELEFSQKNVPRQKLLEEIDETISIVSEALDKLNENDLGNEYPVQVFAEKTSTDYMLVHLAAHLSYHLGQINYHRRLLD